MKALSVRQPWAWLICAGRKDIENRSWKLPPNMVGKRIYVHAGKQPDKEAASSYPWRKDTGCIIGEVTITGCVTKSTSSWFKGPYGFTLTNPVLYDKSIPYKGQLNFFEVQRPLENEPVN